MYYLGIWALELLEASGHKDETIVGDIAEGFKLSGPIPPSGVYRSKGSSATLSTSALRKAAHVLRKGILPSAKGSGDDELDKATFEATVMNSRGAGFSVRCWRRIYLTGRWSPGDLESAKEASVEPSTIIWSLG